MEQNTYTYTPYTYLLSWIALGKKYYGVRYARTKTKSRPFGCHPSDLFVTYFTSSKIVKRFIKENGNPDIISIRRTFTTASEAELWERKVLRRLRVSKKEEWLNVSDKIGYVTPIGEYHHMYGKHHTQETKNKISSSLRGRVQSLETRLKRSKSHKGSKRPPRTETHREKLAEANKLHTGNLNPNYGNKWSNEQKKLASVKMKAKLSTGERTPSFKRIKFRGCIFESFQEAAKTLPAHWSYNRCWYNIRKECEYL